VTAELEPVPDVTTSISPMLQYLDAELETRSGLARQSQGIITPMRQV